MSSCTELARINVYPEVPADVRFVYAAVQSEDGRVEATPLEPWPGVKLELNGRPGLSRWVVGFSDPAKVVEAAVHQPLRSAHDCEPALPPGSWCQMIGDDPLAEPMPCSALSTPPVTFDGLEAFRRCTDAVAIRVSCDEQELNCAWSLAGADCRYEAKTCSILPTFTFAFDGIARACDLAAPGGCSLAEPPGALGTLECANAAGACRAELHRVPEVPWLAVTDRIRLVDAEPRIPTSVVDGSGPLYRPDLQAGYAYDFAVEEGRLHVAQPIRGEVGAWFEFPLTDLRTGSRLIVLEPDGRVVAESIVFPEPTIGIEGFGSGSIALMGIPPLSLVLRRFDRDGNLVVERSFDASALGVPGLEMGGAIVADDSRLFLSIRGFDYMARVTGSVLFQLDPTTLSTRAMARFTSPPEGLEARRIGALALEGDRLLVGDELNDSHLWLDARTLEKIAEVPAHGSGDRLAPHNAGMRGLAPLLDGSRPGFDIVDLERTDAIRVSRFEVPGPPTGVGPWPGAPDWASAATFRDFRAYVGPVDLVGLQVLVGAASVGFGVGTRIRSDGGSGLWVLLPWAGEVVRLTPR